MKAMTKRTFMMLTSVVMAMVLIVALVACGKKGDDQSTGGQTTEAPAGGTTEENKGTEENTGAEKHQTGMLINTMLTTATPIPMICSQVGFSRNSTSEYRMDSTSTAPLSMV